MRSATATIPTATITLHQRQFVGSSRLFTIFSVVLSQHFSASMSEGDRRDTILQLTCLVRPVRERAARLIQARLKWFRQRRVRGAARMYERKHSSFHRERDQQPLTTAYEQSEQQQQDQQLHGHASSGPESEADSTTTTGVKANSWCVHSVRHLDHYNTRKLRVDHTSALRGHKGSLPIGVPDEERPTKIFDLTASVKSRPPKIEVASMEDWHLALSRQRRIRARVGDVTVTSTSS